MSMRRYFICDCLKWKECLWQNLVELNLWQNWSIGLVGRLLLQEERTKALRRIVKMCLQGFNGYESKSELFVESGDVQVIGYSPYAWISCLYFHYIFKLSLYSRFIYDSKLWMTNGLADGSAGS